MANDMTKGFDFKVDEYLKGSGDSVIDVEVPEAMWENNYPEAKFQFPDAEPKAGKNIYCF
jgi:hypothetical protein